MPYDSADEHSLPDEGAAQASIGRSLRAIQDTTFRDYGHAQRAVHAKSHALLEGELQVLDGLPPDLAQGVFAKPATYPVVLRFSTNPGDVLDDSISVPRGLAIKVIGVEGDRLPGSEGQRTQDFVMANGPAFVVPGPAEFARNLKLLAATTDTGQSWKKLLSAALRGLAAAGKAAGLDTSKLGALGGRPMTNPLGDTFYTQTPYRYGPHVAKLSVVPTDPALSALRDRPVALGGHPNALRTVFIAHLAGQGATWEMRVQLRTDPAHMPVEDASVPWPEDRSAFVAVAKITVKPQPAWSEARAQAVDDRLAFSPWNGIEAHRPLGALNRARRQSYAASAAFRSEHNACPIHQPRDRVVLPSDPARAFGEARGRDGRRPGTPDARPGAWSQPVRPPVKQAMAGALGGLGAGLLLSAVWLGLESATGETTELVRLQRRTAARAGVRGRTGRGGWARGGEAAPPGASERVVAHAGHLALSAAAGAAYGLVRPAGTSPLVGGAVLGAGFYAAAYGVVGPALGVAPPVWRDARATVAQKGIFHLAFGVLTAELARGLERRL